MSALPEQRDWKRDRERGPRGLLRVVPGGKQVRCKVLAWLLYVQRKEGLGVEDQKEGKGHWIRSQQISRQPVGRRPEITGCLGHSAYYCWV